jgi:hypothetical protein
MANMYKKHFTNNGTVVHIPEGFYYQIEKDKEGGLSVRYSDKKFKGSARSDGEAYRPINHESWAKLLTKPEGVDNIESLVIEKS